tara:strand:+ start:120 stop:275 length:156 start_codon:yes stop_codon:yes gene_type:complete
LAIKEQQRKAEERKMNQKMKIELLEKIIGMVRMIEKNDEEDRQLLEVSMYV